jgi:hypothetical protein
MSAHVKYTPAPQVDPDDHADYTQAPPSYQGEASSANDQERLFGGPRSSEDNIPDDFKVSRASPGHPSPVLLRAACPSSRQRRQPRPLCRNQP